MSDRKAVIKNADMAEDMQQDAIDCATQALEKYNIEKDIAAFIKKEFDKKYNPTWHCIVGRNFGCKLLSDDFKKSLTPVYKLNLLGCGKRGYTIKDLCKAVPWLALEPGDMADPAADFVTAWLIEPVKGLLLG